LYKVTFYSDSAIFGGNEQMALRAYQAMKRSNQPIAVNWIVNSSNLRLIAALDAVGGEYRALDLDPTFRFFRSPPALLRKTRTVAQVIRNSRTQLLMLVQGWIVDGFDGVLAARLARVPYCSYIPMAHSPVELAEGRWPVLRTALRWLFFRCISRYITVDEQQAIRLRHWRSGAKIEVVENFVPRPSSYPHKESGINPVAGIPLQPTVLAVIGRISFRQKCQDWLVDSLGNDPLLSDKTLLFVGDGPDAPRLIQQIKTTRWSDRIHLLGWHDNLEEIYRVLNLLIIPSRAEGMPLVMIEALARRIPVIGSDRDGMRSWLPAEWRFPFRDARAMKDAVACALDNPPVGYWERTEQRLDDATDEHRFAARFAKALFAFSQSSTRS
jgi:glycosyltransferase involved in cell wall biosynthesis